MSRGTGYSSSSSPYWNAERDGDVEMVSLRLGVVASDAVGVLRRRGMESVVTARCADGRRGIFGTLERSMADGGSCD